MDDSEVEGGDNDTPRPPVSKEVVELFDDDEEPYITPFRLDKKMQKMVAPPDDTEVEDSDTEQHLKGKVSKKAAGSNNKVR